MLLQLEQLIDFIQNEYMEFNKKWQKSDYYTKVNLKNNQVCNLLENEKMLNTILNYREFINENNVQLSFRFRQFNNEKAKVSTRAKTKNSIEYKIKNYIENHEGGRVPINKCFNDLFGIRIIYTEKITNSEIKEYVENRFKNLKCIDSSKHIYFKEDNFSFQWELQVWDKIDEINNINSHEKYKQDYVKWERENKGGNG